MAIYFGIFRTNINQIHIPWVCFESIWVTFIFEIWHASIASGLYKIMITWLLIGCSLHRTAHNNKNCLLSTAPCTRSRYKLTAIIGAVFLVRHGGTIVLWFFTAHTIYVSLLLRFTSNSTLLPGGSDAKIWCLNFSITYLHRMCTCFYRYFKMMACASVIVPFVCVDAMTYICSALCGILHVQLPWGVALWLSLSLALKLRA